jgi:hypothetical protein
MATDVGSDRHGGCMVERGAEITLRSKITLCPEESNLEKGQSLATSSYTTLLGSQESSVLVFPTLKQKQL